MAADDSAQAFHARQGRDAPDAGSARSDVARAGNQPWLRSFGRLRGRTASARQTALLSEALPHVTVCLSTPAPTRLADLFGQPVGEVWLEVGFGGGEHLLWQAKRHPEVGLIGCEPYRDGIIKALSGIEADGLGNVRLHPDDARPLLAWLPPASVGRIFVLFPDPWPKKRHHKRRLIGVATLGMMARVLRPGGELRLATDVADYAAAIAEAVSAQGDFSEAMAMQEAVQRPPDWPPTRYEQKAQAAGRTCHYIALRRS